MRIRTLLIVGLAWATLGLTAARAEKRALIEREAPAKPALQPAKAATTASSDPAEPPVKVEVSFTSDVYARTGRVDGTAVPVTSGAKGTTLTLTTPGGYNGTAQLTFTNSAGSGSLR